MESSKVAMISVIYFFRAFCTARLNDSEVVEQFVQILVVERFFHLKGSRIFNYNSTINEEVGTV